MFASASVFSAGAYEQKGDFIKTEWASQVGPGNARPEYPRPQMVRKNNWTNLNGLWNYAIAPAGGNVMPPAEGEILVPFCVESSLSGVGKRLEPGQALWYQRTIAAPAKSEGKRLLLHFDAVDWSAEVFLNDRFIGSHTGGFTAFTFDITEYLAEGPADLKVKVTDPTDSPDACIPRGKQVSEPDGIWYTPVTGIWQTVWVEAVSDKAYISDYNVTTDIRTGEITVDVQCTDSAAGDKIRVDVLRPKIGYNPEKPGWTLFRKGRATVNAGESATIRLRRPKLWTVDKPYLYGLRISLIRDGKTIDRVDAYTALRKVDKKADEKGVLRLALNDNILFQFGPLDQGWWPDGLYTAPTAQAMLFDIVKTKELGFNMIRKHIKVEPARWYYDCDREGMMVWQDMPSIAFYAHPGDWSQGKDYYGSGRDYPATEVQKENYYKEWAEIIGQFGKFQSIVVWVPFNEGWGQFDTEAVCEYTRKLDPSRLINAASGGNWRQAGDILDSHHYPQPLMRILDPAMVNVLGEYGGIGLPVEGHTWDIGKKWGYVQYDSEEKVTDTYCMYVQDLLDIKQNDCCAAAVYTQTTDVEGEVNGFYTYDRAVLKMNARRVREANLRVINAPDVPELPLVTPSDFHVRTDKGRYLKLYTLRNGDLTMQVTDLGARVISLFVPDRDGNIDDVVVGYGDGERFLHNSGERFLGATVGRVANRIAGGSFTLDGKTYSLPKNNNGQTLHGGELGVDMLVWKLAERTDSSLTFKCLVPDGQDGFPGNLDIELTYTLTSDNCFDIRYKAVTDKATPVNLSNHAFYNLRGSKGGTILDHVLTIDADAITPVDKVLIPTGELMPVDGTPFDFREAHTIGERLHANDVQLDNGGGYDHNWVLNAPADGELHSMCTLYEPESGRFMEVLTDQPGLQFYCGNFFDGSYCGKVAGQPIGYREALAIETQKWPDAVHHPSFPDTILRPGETYTQHSVYKFSVR